jgi:predicted anti-sigma-YlaC factor YlaD
MTGAPRPGGNFSRRPPHYLGMECDSVRDAISAQIDGADPGLPGSVIAGHLAGCADCRAWQQRAHAVTRRMRLGGAFLDHDLTPAVLAATAAAPARWRPRLAQRGALIALAAGQFAIAAPMLFLGHDHDAGTHAAHELGSFNMALAIAFAVGAVRPALSAGLAWVSGFAAAGLVATAIADLISGQAIGADEAQHLVAAAGAALLVWQARTTGRETAGAAAAPAAAGIEVRPNASEGSGISLPDAAQDRPGGGDAARLTAPDVAARAMDRRAGSGEQATRQSDAAGRDRPGRRDEEVA